MAKKQFLMGSKIVVKAALAAGAEAFFGYPITPTTEILEFWADEASKNKKIKFLQTEDEMAAGFALIGSVLVGKKSFTATAGPGSVLAQDAFGMAEAMRMPTVAVIGQRGGPSTGTVIYSQQEVTLTCFGGHGEGHRIVYSPSSLQELYDLTIKSFNSAWQYRFPTFLLTDGYLLKMKGEVALGKPNKLINSKPILDKKSITNIRNCYDQEGELYEVTMAREKEFKKITPKVSEFEYYGDKNPAVLIMAHGIVGAAAKQALSNLKSQNSRLKTGLFRPITLRPFPEIPARNFAKKAKKILIFESSLSQFSNLVKTNLYGLDIPIESFGSPSLGITPEEIIKKIKNLK